MICEEMKQKIKRFLKILINVSPLRIWTHFFIRRKLKKIAKDEMLIICPGGIGDTVIALILADQIKQHYQKRSLVFMAKKSHGDLFRIWKQDKSVIFVENRDMRLLDLAARPVLSRKKKKSRRFIVGKLSVYDETAPHHSINFYPEVCEKVYGLSTVYDYRKSRYYLKNDNCKSVLFVPYTVSVKYDNYEVFEFLQHELSGRGYDIFTNTTSNNAIGGTQPFNLSLFDMIQTINRFCYVISYRSGMNDLFEVLGIRQIVIYPNEEIKNYYTTRKMRKDSITKDIVLNGNSKEICREIVELIENKG